MRSLKPGTVGYIVILLALISLGMSAKSSYDTRQVNQKLILNQNCINGFLAENSRITKIRSDATVQKDEVEDSFLDGLTGLALRPDPDPKKNQERFKVLSTERKNAARTLREERARNPLPDPPTKCSDLPKP